MNEIRCPKCGEVFTVDESGYAAIVKQVHDKEFNAEIKRRISGVGVYPSFGASFVDNYDGFIRLNLACPREMLQDALRRICDAME